MTEVFRAAPHVARLKGFQQDTVRHVVNRFYGPDPTRRFLVADETGLGKSVVARGVIAEAVERLMSDDNVDRIDIIYVCSNADIAAQNLRRLNVLGGKEVEFHTRLTMLATETGNLNNADRRFGKPINLIAFTPATSFERGWATGKASERAVLFLLLKPLLSLSGARETAALRALQGTVTKLERFRERVERYAPRAGEDGLDPTISAEFSRLVSAEGLNAEFEALIGDIGLIRNLPPELRERARVLTGKLRTALARASIEALEPDLVILDEFQRFRTLLDPTNGGDAAELAHELFEWGDTCTLLLSATPYKPFSTADEDNAGESHYEDFITTLRFLCSGDEAWIAEVKAALGGFRERLLSGQSTDDAGTRLRELLLGYMCRTERPQVEGATAEVATTVDTVTAKDFRDFVHLRKIAAAVDAPVEVEYWKSAPYFINFLEGYKVGERLRHALKAGTAGDELRESLDSIAQIDRRALETFAAIDPGNARLRDLARRTVGAGWWKLLWIPPSMPYLEPGGPYAEPWAADVTKQLIFSSWNATPTAIASLLSYEADRQIAAGSSKLEVNTPEARERRATLLEYRVEDERAAAMTTLAIFWPHPALAAATDPLRYAREIGGVVPPQAWADGQLRLAARLDRGQVAPSEVVTDYFGWPGALPADLRPTGSRALAAMITGNADDEDETSRRPGRLDVHVAQALRTEEHRSTSSELAHVAMNSPGNIAWRALSRVLTSADSVDPAGHWHAAARLANGLRSLFNRLEPTLLLGALYDVPYWQAVLAYCRDGNLQAVLDEYLHHLRSERGEEALNNEALLALATSAAEAVSVRPSRYRGVDPSNFDDPLAFNSRFALRYGAGRNEKTDSDDHAARKPQVRAAFNSPFWPFVLATTSAGQEGIDFHWWCHSVVHWNTPSNPVDFEQREGRVNRFGGHAVRRNVANAHRDDALRSADPDPWKVAYDAATSSYPEFGDFSPYWVYPGPHAVERHLLPYPLSRDRPRAESLKRDLALYRLALGQPRQDDLLSNLAHQSAEAQRPLDLRPPVSETP
jgi:hypothetical protein